ncbi:MAG: sulfite exporter TauE/SafE family protein [Salinirussus sp.]
MTAQLLGFEPALLGVLFGVVFFGGFVKGVAGFGYAIAGTAVLASIIEPSVAVVVMILPMLVANVTLLRELDDGELRACSRRFWPFLVAAVAGTLAGMVLLDVVPRAMLSLGLGLFTLGYVVVTQERVRLPGERFVAEVCFNPGSLYKAALGLVSGLIFGASNVAVQVVAYLDSLDLDASTFAGVLAMILVGVSSVRVGAAWLFGLYGTGSLLAVSAVAAVPGLLGVAAGSRIRSRIPPAYQTAGALVLLTVIGLKLTYDGSIAVGVV